MSLLLSMIVWAAPDASIMTAIEGGQLDQAEKMLLDKRERGSWDLDDQMTLAAVCLGKGDLECAEYLYRESMRPQPRTALAYFGLAEIARVRGQMSRAKDFYRSYLESSLPGRDRGYDTVAQQRLTALINAPSVAPGRVQSVRAPSFRELSWAASRYAGLSFFPALLGGSLAAAVAASQFDSRGDDWFPIVAGLGTGMAIFGSGVAWGVDRQARLRNYRGPFGKTAASAVLVPAAILLGGSFIIANGGLDDDLVGPLMVLGTASSVFLVPPYVYMQEMEPIQDE